MSNSSSSGLKELSLHNLTVGSAPRRLISRHALNVMLTFGSQGCERALTFAAVTLLLRILPASEGGSFVLMLKVAGFTGVFATLGLQGGAVSLISGALGAGREMWANALLRAFLLTRIYMAIALLLLGIVGSSWIASALLRNPSAAPYVEWGCISGSTNAILMFSLHHLQARQAFAKYTVLTVITSLSKLITIVLLMSAEVVTAYRVAALWALLPLAGAALGLFLAPRQFLRRTRRAESRRARMTLTRIGRWLTLSSLIGVIFINLDSLLVARYLGLAAVGRYGAAINLSLIVMVLGTSLFTVMLPAVSRMSSREQVRRFFRRALLLTSLGSLALLPVVLAAPWLVRKTYGSHFLTAVPAFRFLFVGALIAVIYSTAGVVFLARKKPIHVVGQAATQVVASVPFYFVLIPRDGIVGGAIGTFAGQVAALLYVLFFGTLVLRRKADKLVGHEWDRGALHSRDGTVDEYSLTEAERIRKVYHDYDLSRRHQRKRDESNVGIRLIHAERWNAVGRAISAYFADGAPVRVLDIGCGEGDDLARVAGLLPRAGLFGIDLLPDRIARARLAVPQADLRVDGGEALDFPDKSFDLVIMSTVLSSILDPAIRRVVAAEALRVVTAEGLLLIYDMRLPNPLNRNTRAITRRELRSLLPAMKLNAASITLLPPLARKACGIWPGLYGPLRAVRPLRSHYLTVVTMDRRHARADHGAGRHRAGPRLQPGSDRLAQTTRSGGAE
jgi:O-antigen/teichoic acid export membrane protein/ubiquinone/menaquinone biosynthesis C-methylase UbiE